MAQALRGAGGSRSRRASWLPHLTRNVEISGLTRRKVHGVGAAPREPSSVVFYQGAPPRVPEAESECHMSTTPRGRQAWRDGCNVARGSLWATGSTAVFGGALGGIPSNPEPTRSLLVALGIAVGILVVLLVLFAQALTPRGRLRHWETLCGRHSSGSELLTVKSRCWHMASCIDCQVTDPDGLLHVATWFPITGPSGQVALKPGDGPTLEYPNAFKGAPRPARPGRYEVVWSMRLIGSDHPVLLAKTAWEH